MPWMTSGFGWVFMGMHPVDQDDYDWLASYLAGGGLTLDDVAFDEASLVGRLDRSWTCGSWENGQMSRKLGGEGSHTYETQKVIGGNFGSGDVEFKPEDQKEIWHRDPDGNKVHGKVDYPRLSRSYHVNEWGETTAGPKPGTNAESRLGDGKYAFQEKNAWWVVRNT